MCAHAMHALSTDWHGCNNTACYCACQKCWHIIVGMRCCTFRVNSLQDCLSSRQWLPYQVSNFSSGCAQVRHRGTFELQTLKSAPLMPFGAFNKDQQRFPEMRECFLVITLPSANMSLSEITIDLANKNRTITAVLEVLSLF